MSTHGRGGLGRWAYGSVTEAVIRTCAVPVLVVPAHCDVDWRERQDKPLLVALDGSP